VGRPQLGPKAQPNCQRSTLADSGRQLVSTIPFDSGRILTQDRCHWKLYEILIPTIYRTSKTDSVCDLGVCFIAHCELELILASTSGTRTGSTLDLLLDLETFVGLFLLHSMHQSWSYAWVSCPHHKCSQYPNSDQSRLSRVAG
jgi:hypothetical protein